MTFHSKAFSNDLSKFPRVGVGCIVQQKGKLLLGERKGSLAEGYWGFPGGHLEFGETVEDCATRELLEETGLKPTSIRLGPWVENFIKNTQKHYITIFVFIDDFIGKPQRLEPHKCLGWEWFDLNSLPEPLFSPIPSLLEKHPKLFDQIIPI